MFPALPVILTGAALFASVSQWILARRADLGVVSVSLCVLAALNPMEDWTWGILSLAAAFMGLGWVRGAHHGGGRPGLSGAAVSLGCLVLWLPVGLARLGVSVEIGTTVASVAAALGAWVGLWAALDRRRQRRKPRWVGEIPVRSVGAKAQAPDQR